MNMEELKNQNLNDQAKIDYILNGLEGNEAFNQFIKLFEEQAKAADEYWQTCLIETEKGKESFYSLRAHKLALITILNKLDELRAERDRLKDEIEAQVE